MAKNDNPEKELDLFDHLAELRARILRSLLYIGAGMIVGWILFDQIYEIILRPAIQILKPVNGHFLQTSFVQGFTLRIQVSLIGGLILAAPFWTMEIWMFIAPGLTKQERKAMYLVAPLSIILFALGVALCFIAMPRAFAWFVAMVPPKTQLIPDVSRTLLFVVQMYLAFGIMFELPVFLMFLGKIGLVTSDTMKRMWREATLLTAFAAALVTPSNDAFTMLMMAIPMVILYFLSILLVRWVEPK